MTEPAKKPACTFHTITVTPDQLPISCPMPDMQIWNAHPRVYLALNDNNEAVCPYCGTVYVLKDEG